MSSVCSRRKMSSTSSCVMIPTSMSVASTTGMAIRSYFSILRATLSWSSSTRAKIASRCMMSSIRVEGRARIRLLSETMPMSRRWGSTT